MWKYHRLNTLPANNRPTKIQMAASNHFHQVDSAELYGLNRNDGDQHVDDVE
jgi:hypothetical protein